MNVAQAGLLNRAGTVRRRVDSPDGAGGYTTTWATVGTVPCRVSQPTDDQRTTGGQDGTDLTQPIYLAPDADVRRGDELHVDGLVLEVLATFGPSEPVYLRADCRSRQTEGGTPWPAG